MLTFQDLEVRRFRGLKIGGWYEIIMSTFAAKLSSITDSVKSLVNMIFLIGLSFCLGSIRRPTLSQEPARDDGAKFSKTFTTFVRFMFSMTVAPTDEKSLLLTPANMGSSRIYLNPTQRSISNQADC